MIQGDARSILGQGCVEVATVQGDPKVPLVQGVATEQGGQQVHESTGHG